MRICARCEATTVVCMSCRSWRTSARRDCSTWESTEDVWEKQAVEHTSKTIAIGVERIMEYLTARNRSEIRHPGVTRIIPTGAETNCGLQIVDKPRKSRQ